MHNSDRLLKIMKRIDKWQVGKSLKRLKEKNFNLNQGRVRKKVEQLGPIENDPEYQLIVEVTQC